MIPVKSYFKEYSVSDGIELWLRRTGFWWLICFGAAVFSVDHDGWLRLSAATVTLVALSGGLLGTWWLIRSPEPSAEALDRLDGKGEETGPIGKPSVVTVAGDGLAASSPGEPVQCVGDGIVVGSGMRQESVQEPPDLRHGERDEG